MSKYAVAVGLAALSVSTVPAANVANAEELAVRPSAPSENLDEVIVTGTRRAERTVSDSNVPVDVVDAADIGSVPSADLNDKLAQLVPSFNVQRLPLFDGQVFVRPATLRGLSPDQTLVLVNGVRRHRSAYVDPGQTGAQAVDLSQIPQIALKRVEVLRDGASAQYGSDAIAGVINLILEDRPGLSFDSQFGQYYAGDGNNVQLAGRGGFALGDRGTFNLSLEYADGEATDRGGAIHRIGQPDLESYRTFYNLEVALAPALSLYSFGNYSHAKGWSDFNHRTTDNNIYARSFFQDNPPHVAPDYSLASRYPNGFIPIFGSKTDDVSLVAGLKGELSATLSWDVGGRYGRNKINYFIHDTINASLGPESPTSFDIGDWIQTEDGVNLNLNYLWDAGLANPANLAFGAEWREEQFEIVAGEPDSYRSGAFPDLIPGSDGFPGFSPEQSGTWDRHSTAAYVDVDADLTERLNIDVAGRFEDYSDFGTTWNYKIASRFKLLDSLNLRAALSTGFRAPTPGQQNLTKTSQGPDPRFPPPATQVIIASGRIPSISPVAVAVGGKPLTAEDSTNYSLGLVFKPISGLTLSVDLYRIDIDDRLGATSDLELTDEQRATLVASGVTSAATLDQFSFFINGYSTRTEGVDIVGTYGFDAGPGTVRLTGAFNHNRSRLTHGDPAVVNDNVRQYVEDRLPENTGNLAVNYDVDRFGFLARARYYSAWTDALNFFPAETNQRVGAETFLDLAVSYAFDNSVQVTVGAENVFGNYPDRNTTLLAAGGQRYPLIRAYDADGGRYYARVSASF